ncbi:hypothetical protein A2U01_0029191, partial [Trifolium medium]|nr:hypothetical protein [Trifolium medium]
SLCGCFSAIFEFSSASLVVALEVSRSCTVASCSLDQFLKVVAAIILSEFVLIWLLCLLFALRCDLLLLCCFFFLMAQAAQSKGSSSATKTFAQALSNSCNIPTLKLSKPCLK